jgi:hypothetical protein
VSSSSWFLNCSASWPFCTKNLSSFTEPSVRRLSLNSTSHWMLLAANQSVCGCFLALAFFWLYLSRLFAPLPGLGWVHFLSPPDPGQTPCALFGCSNQST